MFRWILLEASGTPWHTPATSVSPVGGLLAIVIRSHHVGFVSGL